MESNTIIFPILKMDKSISTDNELEYIFPSYYSEFDKLDLILQKLMEEKLHSITKFDTELNQDIKIYRNPKRKKIHQNRLHRRKYRRRERYQQSIVSESGSDLMSKRAKWVIIATSCLLIFLCLFLVGITLRMTPLIDELVRKENEELISSINRKSSVNETN